MRHGLPRSRRSRRRPAQGQGPRLLPDAEPLPPPRLVSRRRPVGVHASVGSSYARYHNDRLGRDGPIFRGRFHRCASTPTTTSLVPAGTSTATRSTSDPTSPSTSTAGRAIATSSAHATAPKWLSTSELLEPIGGPARYRSFVEVETGRGLLEWAIDTAILEGWCDDVTIPNLRRTVMLAMLASAPGPMAGRLSQILAFPSDAARHSAMHRMRRHVDAHPGVVAIVERALRLAA